MRMLLVTTVLIVMLVSLACATDGKCEDASRKSNYSNDPQEIRKAMEYFRENCTWRNGRPVAK